MKMFYRDPRVQEYRKRFGLRPDRFDDRCRKVKLALLNQLDACKDDEARRLILETSR